MESLMDTALLVRQPVGRVFPALSSSSSSDLIPFTLQGRKQIFPLGSTKGWCSLTREQLCRALWQQFSVAKPFQPFHSAAEVSAQHVLHSPGRWVLASSPSALGQAHVGRQEFVLHVRPLQSQVAMPGSSWAPSCAWPGLAVCWGLPEAQLSTRQLNLSCSLIRATSQIPVSCCSVSHGWISSQLKRHMRVFPMIWGTHNGSFLYGFLDVLQKS